jgi:hypothetical protein
MKRMLHTFVAASVLLSAPAFAANIYVNYNITTDTTWSAANTYELGGKIKVKDGAKLTIEPGTLVAGNSSSYLVVTAGSTIDAQGTTTSPIIFTSIDAYLGNPEARGQWGGVTILGNAQVNDNNQQYYEVDETDPDFAFGSNTTANNAESSGTLTHVEIRNSGYAVEPGKEVNGLSLCGVGAGTTISDITVVNSGDDGVEIWGGVVNLDNISITNAGDDSFDVDNGYQGTVTNLTIVQQDATAALVEMSTGGVASIFRTRAVVDGFSFSTSANQIKEGGIYFKDGDVAAVFSNGNITHNSLATEGVLHSKYAMNADAKAKTSFTNVTNDGTNTTIATGPAAADLEELYNGASAAR